MIKSSNPSESIPVWLFGLKSGFKVAPEFNLKNVCVINLNRCKSDLKPKVILSLM